MILRLALRAVLGCMLLGMVLIALRLGEVITWAWPLVFAPFLVPMLLGAAALFVAIVVLAVAGRGE